MMSQLRRISTYTLMVFAFLSVLFINPWAGVSAPGTGSLNALVISPAATTQATATRTSTSTRTATTTPTATASATQTRTGTSTRTPTVTRTQDASPTLSATTTLRASLTPTPNSTSTVTPTPVRSANDPDCTVIVPPGEDVIDGDKEYKYIKPGDVICLQAGEHGNLKIRNLDGTAENPITIINYQGKVIITGSVNLSGGIHINNSSYIRLTGSGVSSECGSEFSAEEQNCGIEIFDTWKGVKLDSKDYLHHIEIDHLSIHDTTTETLTRGIAFHPRPYQFIDTIYIHHNYVARTTGEGVYIGSEPNEKPFEELAKLTNVEISYNLVESIGFDGIKTKVVIGSLLIHHNIVLDTGLSNTPAHRGGIKMAMSNGLVYNNYVENSFEGIRMGRALDGANSQYFNNIVVNMSDVGISTKERNASIFNNTVINGGISGIRAEGKSPLVFNNLVIGTTALAIIGPSGSVNNNLVADEVQARFVDFAGGDFHLLPDSPAVDGGLELSGIPETDYDGNPRPVGRAVDIGAYEYNPDVQSSFNVPDLQEQIAHGYQRDRYFGPRIKEFFD